MITRQVIAEYLFKLGLVIIIPCLVVVKFNFFGERVYKVALFGLVFCFILILLRLTLLAFGD